MSRLATLNFQIKLKKPKTSKKTMNCDVHVIFVYFFTAQP